MLTLLGADKFRVGAFERAAKSLDGLTIDIGTIAGDAKALTAIDGIGKSTAAMIAEFVKTGKVEEHDALAAQVPAGLLQILEIPGLGPKTVAMMWKEKGVTDVAGLKGIIESGEILTLPRMGAKTVENIKSALAFAEQAGDRLPLGIALPVAEGIVAYLEYALGMETITYAGSLRRGRDTIGDIDILAATDDPAPAHAAFTKLPGILQVLVSGDTKSSARVRASVSDGVWAPTDASGPLVQVDLRTLPTSSFGAAMMYFTGSKEHNVRLRERAIKMGFRLNEYGLFKDDGEAAPQHRGVKPVAGKTEAEVYKKLGLPFLPPEVREDIGELNFDEVPRLLELDDLTSDLHNHTTESDGVMSLDTLVEASMKAGLKAIAVTDHSRSAIQANGLNVERLRGQREAIDAARAALKKSHPTFTLLHGSEVDIHADGKMDYDNDVLKWLEVVVASPHIALTQDPAVATKRLVRAIENPHVNIIGHPTGRLIGKRAGLDPDMKRVIDAAKANGVALEVNAHWMRLDLRDTHVRAAAEAGCLISINCDTHHAAHMLNRRLAVLTARRGLLPPELCVNTWDAEKLGSWLARKH